MKPKPASNLWQINHLGDEICKISIYGDLDVTSIKKIYPHVKQLKSHPLRSLIIDCRHVTHLDFSGALLLAELAAYFSKQKATIFVENLAQEYKTLLFFARKNLGEELHVEQYKGFYFQKYLQNLGQKIFDMWITFHLFLSFFGQSVVRFTLLLSTPWRFRFRSVFAHIEKSGAHALPIVALTSFLVGLVVAYQGAEQLVKFGANIFIVDMVSISVFRELAPLIAAIVIAGRSSSAYTAQIGTMKITEEIDALRSMGFDPIDFLVLPRILALVFSMPLIVFFADIVGVFGGMIVAKHHLGISYDEFIQRGRDVLEMKHILIGLFKAPFFGLLIALIGCFRGFQVTGSTESIGHYTTISVVNAIFLVIVINAVISVLLTEVGI
ncbi:MAG: ABC transporter permease [Sulfurospirillum sp.]|nr:ABC transporter permease [Sulfurospirillum sp.]